MMKSSTPPRRFPLQHDNSKNCDMAHQSVTIMMDDHCSSSWRSLTPQPKTNAIPASPFEAQIFHRMVEQLQEEQLNQSMQQDRDRPPNHHLPEVQEMDDRGSSWMEQHDDHILEDETKAITNTSSPCRTTSTALPKVVFSTPPRYYYTTDRQPTAIAVAAAPTTTTFPFSYYDEETFNHNEVAPNEAELDVLHDVDDDDKEEDSDVDEENEDIIANSWEWSLHHPKLSKFPDIGSHVGSIEILKMGDLIKTNHHPQNGTTAHHYTKEPSTNATWATGNMFYHKMGTTRIRLIHLEKTMGTSMISGRIHHDPIQYFVFAGRIRLWQLQRDGTTTPCSRGYDNDDIDHDDTKKQHWSVPPYTPHLVETLDESSVLAEWSSSSSLLFWNGTKETTNDDCYYYYDWYTFPPYDDLVVSQQQRTTVDDRTTMVEDSFGINGNTFTLWLDKGSTIANMLKAIVRSMGEKKKTEAFWIGIVAGVSVGFWFGRKRR